MLRRSLDESWAFWAIIFILPGIIFFPATGKNVTLLGSVLTMATAAVGTFVYRSFLRQVTFLLFVLTSLSVVSSIDIDYRRADSFKVAYLPVVYNLGSLENVRAKIMKGETENVDFIVKTRQAFAIPVRASFVVFLPN
jgi:hypothetical protein